MRIARTWPCRQWSREYSDRGAGAQESAALGYECVTSHLGWGLEDDDESFRLIESILETPDRTGVPLYVETHRATIFQDMWRTVNFNRRYPSCDSMAISRTGMQGGIVYRSFEKKFAYIQPVLERVRFNHGRIANPGASKSMPKKELRIIGHIFFAANSSLAGGSN